MKNPHVSIIIPTYNSGKTLPGCLKSVSTQTYPFYEIIVVDNFSTDRTLETARRFKAKVLRQKCSPALARNLGVSRSAGKYVFFLDSDQVMSPTVVQECVERCENIQAGMVRIPEVFIGRGYWGSCSAVWKNYHQKVEQQYPSNKILSGEPRFFAKEQIVRIGMLDASLLWGEDYDLYRRLKKANAKECTCISKIYHYELESVKGILIKNLRYGKSMPAFVQQTKEQMLPRMGRHALLTFKEVFRDFRKSPAIIAGCTILLCLKTYSIAYGLVTGQHLSSR